MLILCALQRTTDQWRKHVKTSTADSWGLNRENNGPKYMDDLNKAETYKEKDLNIAHICYLL